MKNITKSFAGVKVLDDVHFDLYESEVHALLGENGAGKSTLMKILAGVYSKDRGVINKTNTDGKVVSLENITPKQAQEAGISIVFQEFNLLNNISIAENIFIGREPKTKFGTVDWKQLYASTSKILARVKLNKDPKSMVSELSTAEKQLVEIAKSISYKSDIIILDEPTSSLTDNEVEILFDLIGELKNQGMCIVYISHRMEEIFKITDRITVLRDGKFINTFITSGTDVPALIQSMIGRKLNLDRNTVAKDFNNAEVTFSVKNINVHVSTLSKPFSFDLHKGEILGLFGLVGAGRTELARLIFGIDKSDDIEIYKNGKRISIKSPIDAINNGLALVPEDRKELGLILPLSVQNNLVLASLKDMNKIRLTGKEEKSLTMKYIKELHVYLNNENQPVDELSGGNQQKIVVGKWLSISPDILIMDEPTRGIDIGAKAEIYEIMRNLTANGMSILMISSEMPEILHISDRAIVLFEGQKTLDESTARLDQKDLANAAIGGNLK
ncbi:MAG: sugar ABC transporter ATP-binding protein [Flexilinea sp.]